MGYFDSDAEEMLDVYLVETRQLIGQLEAVLLETEKDNVFSEEDIHNCFRVMHTIKSSSAMMGLNGLSVLAHKLEDLFAFYREKCGRIEHAEPELFDLLFEASDFVEKELERMTRQDYQPAGTEKLEAQTEVFLKRASGEADAAQEKALEEEAAPEEFLKKGGTVVRLRLEEDCRMENIRAFMLVRQITGMCREVETYPADLERSGEGAEYIGKNGVFIRFDSAQKEEVLESLRSGLFVASCQVVSDTPVAGAVPAPGSEAGQKPAAPPQENREAEFLSVRTDRLDQLQTLSGELMIQLLILDEELKRGGLLDVREGTAHQINRLVTQVERTVMEMRMVPVARIVPKLRRILRDICRDQKKEAELVVNCGDIEADTGVVDYISESLMHILRNAVDHGIESPEERLKAGKERKGKIIFTVESTVGELIVSLEDDGCGIDLERVRQRAREKKMFVRPEETYDDKETMNLILTPGFTTCDTVTEYSGRGVGLDVVKTILENAGGNIYIQSEQGKGSCFTLSMPLTLANMECIRFRVGDYRFSLPARHVYRFMGYGGCGDRVRRIGDRDYILFEDRMIPLIDLRKFYGLEGEAPESSLVVYVCGKTKEGCILADYLYEQKRIVIKQLPTLFGLDFRRNTGVNGCSIMGDGTICAALDTEILIGRYEKEGKYGGV